MTRMMRFIYVNLFTAFLCLFNQGYLVWSLCTKEDVQIEGGNYRLSNELEEGSKLVYQCEEGFYAHPHLSHVCSYSGMWDPAPRRSTCRQVECPDPMVLGNCNILPSNPRYFYQDQITYECYDGLTLFGPSTRTCLSNGKWSGSHPVCRRDSGDHCPDPGIPPGASRTGVLFNLGEKVTYTCLGRTMILIGSEERVCQEDGSWSGIEPTCYYPHTYDTPLEASQAFGGGMKNTFSSLESDVKMKGRRIQLSESGIFNIYIALDVSSSIKEKHFKMAKSAVMTLIEKIASFSVSPNYDVMFFSSKPIPVIDIVTFFGDKRKPLGELLNNLRNVSTVQRSDKTGTNLKAVFEKIDEKMAIIQTRQGPAKFAEHHHAIIVFTDGQLNMGGKPNFVVDRIKDRVLMKQNNRDKHLDIYLFGIGEPVYDENLKSLAFPTNEPHYFRLKDLKELNKAFDEIINEEDIKGLCGLHRNYTYVDPQNQEKRWKYPWAMSVVVLTDDGAPSNCLGSLVSPRFVLTAAHCFTVNGFIKDIKVEYASMQLGVKNRTSYIPHPLYKIDRKKDQGVEEFYDYDVALLELERDVQLAASLRPICLPCTVGANSALGQNFTCEKQEEFLIANRQRITFLSKSGDDLREKFAHIEIANREKCIKKALNATGITTNNASVAVTENFLCTGGGTSNEVDHISCKGDSGGAVFRNYNYRTIQVALVSWGSKETLSCSGPKIALSDGDSRDFHINLFKVVPFLKSILGEPNKGYEPLPFID